jgi:hypothetical protein
MRDWMNRMLGPRGILPKTKKKKIKPHQGEKEIARKLDQIANGKPGTSNRGKEEESE